MQKFARENLQPRSNFGGENDLKTSNFCKTISSFDVESESLLLRFNYFTLTSKIFRKSAAVVVDYFRSGEMFEVRASPNKLFKLFSDRQ